MQFSETLKTRHSVRFFEEKPVDEALLLDIVRDATQAPSWVNAQEWKIYIALGKTLETIRHAFSARVKANIEGTSDIPVTHRESFSTEALENMRRFLQARSDAGLEQVKLETQAELFHAPAVCFLTVPKTFSHFMLFDLGAFSQTLMLAAADRGIASIVAWNPVKYPDILRNNLPIPDTQAIAIAISLGYEKKHPINDFRSERRRAEDILTLVR